MKTTLKQVLEAPKHGELRSVWKCSGIDTTLYFSYAEALQDHQQVICVVLQEEARQSLTDYRAWTCLYEGKLIFLVDDYDEVVSNDKGP